MPIYQILSPGGLFSGAPPTRIVVGIASDEVRGFRRSLCAEPLRFEADGPRLLGRRVNCWSRASSLKAHRTLARRRCVAS